MTTLPTLTAYTDWLVDTLTNAVTEEHTAAYRSRLAASTPEPITVKRYRCPHCGTSRAKEGAARAHMARCWHNPNVRACKTCIHFEPGQAAGGCWGDPYCNCPEVPEYCAISQWPSGVSFPVVDCPSWETAP